MLSKILSLSKRLISIPSTTENPKELYRVLEVAKKELKGFTIEEFEKDRVPSLLAYKEKTRPKRFKIIFNAHLDVVPAKPEQYAPVEKNGKLYARGAHDMKVGGAAQILAFKELANTLPYPIGLQLVTDEEIGGTRGTKYQLDRGVRSDFAIAGESTELMVKNKAKGVIWTRISARGKAAHAAYPWQGESAVWKINKLLNEIVREFPEQRKETTKTTVNPAALTTTNKTYNKVADDCTLMIDMRFAPEDADAFSRLKKVVPKDFDVEIIENEPAQFTDPKNPYLTTLMKAIEKITSNKAQFATHKHGASDIRHFNRVGCDGVEFGPAGYGLHTDGEWVDIKSIGSYFEILKIFLKSL